MDPPIYSLPSEFSDTILSENIRHADHEEKIVKIGRKRTIQGRTPRIQSIFNFGNGKHTSHAHTLTASSEAAEREKS